MDFCMILYIHMRSLSFWHDAHLEQCSLLRAAKVQNAYCAVKAFYVLKPFV